MTEGSRNFRSGSHPTIEIVDGTNGRAMYITIDGYMFYIDNTTDEQIIECWKDDGTDGMYWKKKGVMVNDHD